MRFSTVASSSTVALQLGHKDLRQAARYQHLAPTFLQDAVRGLDGVFGPELVGVPQVSGPALLSNAVEGHSVAFG